MDFGAFTDEWEWRFAVIGLGVVMVAIFRAVFGKPKLEFDLFVVNESKQQRLICKLKNSPFRNWVMKLLWVPRPYINSAFVRCDVLDWSFEMRKVGSFVVDMKDADGKVSKQLPLPASILPVEFSIATFSQKVGKAVLENTQGGVIPLLDGVLYLIRLVAVVADKEVKSQLTGLVIKEKMLLIKNLSESFGWGYEI